MINLDIEKGKLALSVLEREKQERQQRLQLVAETKQRLTNSNRIK